jgi:hypothetical protein
VVTSVVTVLDGVIEPRTVVGGEIARCESTEPQPEKAAEIRR